MRAQARAGTTSGPSFQKGGRSARLEDLDMHRTLLSEYPIFLEYCFSLVSVQHRGVCTNSTRL
ncbi:hypothetical protein ACEPAG_8762 [Sanghuangporus baumii]